MNNIEELYQILVEAWRLKARGNGIINFGSKVNYMPVILGVLQRIYERAPTVLTYIVCDTTNTKYNIINYITNTDNKENNNEFNELLKNNNIRVREASIMNTFMPKESIYLSIFVGVNNASPALHRITEASKFNLLCITAFGNLYSLKKKFERVGDDEIKKLAAIYTNTPVEEYQIGINITDEKELDILKQYNEYISDSVKVFGSFEVMGYAKRGNSLCNVSATQICYDIAKQNGWNETLDMSIEFNRQIDACYNPNTLHERVEITYDIIRKRAKLVNENAAKLPEILNIVSSNPNKRILIVSKSTEFAKQVTNYLNDNIQGNVYNGIVYNACYNYHDDVDKMPAIDDFGQPILVKSGVDKGKPKYLGAKAQRSLVEDYLNKGLTNVLSANNSPDKNLCCNFDILIITSASCELFENYKYRLSNCCFSGFPFMVFRLYCFGTTEQRDLLKQKPKENYTIVNNSKNDVIYDENLGIILGD